MSYHIHENEQTTPQNLLSGEPVCVLKGDEFLPKDGITFIQQVEDFFRKQGGLAHSAFGDVILDKKGIKNDFHHGMSPIKRASFAAIKDVLEKGSIILPLSYYHTNDKKQLTGMVAAPIIIDNEKYVCVVEVIANVSTQRLYVHESFLSKTLQDIVATSPVHNSTNTASRQHQGEIAKVLQNHLESKETSVKNTENNNKTNENKTMNKKQTIRLNEGQLRQIVSESVKKMLNELNWKTYMNAARKSGEKGNDSRKEKFLKQANDSIKQQYQDRKSSHHFDGPGFIYDVSDGEESFEPFLDIDNAKMISKGITSLKNRIADDDYVTTMKNYEHETKSFDKNGSDYHGRGISRNPDLSLNALNRYAEKDRGKYSGYHLQEPLPDDNRGDWHEMSKDLEDYYTGKSHYEKGKGWVKDDDYNEELDESITRAIRKLLR